MGFARALLSLPFIGAHVLAVVLPFYVGASAELVGLCLGAYVVRMFFLTAGYHRYFSHRSFKTSRVFQFFLAFMACTCAQKGPLWWAGHHRNHHRYSDQPDDVHSAYQHGFWWSHVGWVLSSRYKEPALDAIRDFEKFPELRWLDRFHLLPPLLGLVVVYLIGGWPYVVWGGLVSTVLLWHGTFTINSLAHVFGKQRYQTDDQSRNNFFLALITLGEGWHNNHHHYQSSANQGFFWWEIDLTFYVLVILEKLRIIHGLRRPSQGDLSRNLTASTQNRP